MPTPKVPTVEDLENLFINNKDFDDIEHHINQFNPIKIMGMERMEIKHSAILAWLLTPNESHGFGDSFLKAFLADAFQGRSDQNSLNSLSIIQENFTVAEVRREWKGIDLFILHQTEDKKWAFVIENKFDSKQGKTQLKDYREKASNIYDPTNTGVEVYCIFLTLRDEEPNDPSYNPINYNSIYELLTRLIVNKKNMMSPDVITFLGYYLETIGKATGMNEQQNSMEILARDLYRKHKQSLDFIIKHGANTDFAFAAHTIFGAKPEYPNQVEIEGNQFIFHNLNNQTVSFLPLEWFNAFGGNDTKWHGCDKWWAEFPLVSWITLHPNTDNNEGQLKLYAEVGPLSDYEFRLKLMEEIERIAAEQNFKTIAFNKNAKNEGAKYSKFFKGRLAVLQINDINDSDEIAKGIKKLLSSYRKEFHAISTILDQFQHYGLRNSKKG